MQSTAIVEYFTIYVPGRSFVDFHQAKTINLRHSSIVTVLLNIMQTYRDVSISMGKSFFRYLDGAKCITISTGQVASYLCLELHIALAKIRKHPLVKFLRVSYIWQCVLGIPPKGPFPFTRVATCVSPVVLAIQKWYCRNGWEFFHSHGSHTRGSWHVFLNRSVSDFF